MARTARQSKILELISKDEIETQEDLSQALKNSGCKVTQATISRDIKELGVIKILSPETKKYKYAIRENSEQISYNRFNNIFKESIVSVKESGNLIVVKTIRGMASAISGFIDKTNITNVLGTVYGDNTVMVIVADQINVKSVSEKINKVLLR